MFSSLKEKKGHGPNLQDHFLNKYTIDSICDISVQKQICYYNFIMGSRQNTDIQKEKNKCMHLSLVGTVTFKWFLTLAYRVVFILFDSPSSFRILMLSSFPLSLTLNLEDLGICVVTVEFIATLHLFVQLLIQHMY